MYSFHPLGIRILSFAEFVIEKKNTKFLYLLVKHSSKKGQHYYKNTEIEAVRTRNTKNIQAATSIKHP